MNISRELETCDQTLISQSRLFLEGRQPFGFNRKSGYLVLTYVTLPLMLTVGSVASGMIGQIALVFSPLSIEAKELSVYSFEISEKSSQITQEAFCKIGYVFQKNLFPHTPAYFNDRVRALNPLMPHILTAAASLSPLALVYFTYLPKVMLSVPRTTISWLLMESGNSLFQRCVKTCDPHEKTNNNLLNHALIKPLCHAAVMRGIQVGLQSLLSNLIRNQVFMLLGFQFSIAGIAVTLILAAITYEQTGKINYLKSIFIDLEYYRLPLETHGFLTSVYGAVLYDTISYAVAPIISSFALNPVKNAVIPRVKTLLDENFETEGLDAVCTIIAEIPSMIEQMGDA